MREGWTETTLDGIADYLNGHPFKPSDLGEEGIPVIRIKQLLDPTEPLDRTHTLVPEKNHLQNGDIVFSWSGTLAVRIWDRGEAFLNQHLFKVVEKTGVVRPFLPLALEHAIDDLVAKSHGTTMKHITKQTLLPHKINLPPLTEQKRIVDLISCVDSYIDALEQQAESARKSRSAVLHEMLSAGGDGWTETTLGEITSKITDGSHNPPSAVEESKYLMLSSRDIQDDQLVLQGPRSISFEDFIIENKRTNAQLGDVLLTTVGTIGRCAVYDGIPKNATFQRSVALITPIKEILDSRFLMHTLIYKQKSLDELAAGVAQRGLYLKQIRAIQLSVPPIKDQKFIVGTLDSISQSVKMTEKLISETKRLRSGLLSDLLSGDHEIPESYDKVMGAA